MRRLSPLLIAVLVLFFAGVADAENWARFRGPDGKGIFGPLVGKLIGR